MPHIVVIGAGVIGLSSALEIQAHGLKNGKPYEVTIVARDFPMPSETIDAQAQIDFTSPWGGAHNRWVPPSNAIEERDHQLSIKTFHKMKSLHKSNPEAGITFMKGIEYLEAPSAVYQTLTESKAQELGLQAFRLLKESELPDKVKWGCEYDTWCVNPMVYCSYLLRRFGLLGGKVVKKGIREPSEIFMLKQLGKVDAVVNCSGNGFGDNDVFITRGQTCLVANSCPATVTRQNADGSWTFCVPRNFDGGTIIGGTKQVNNWDPNPSLEVRESLLKNFAATYPAILSETGEFRVLKDVVGRRPTRHGGLRLEKEAAENGKCVIHAYGLGGRGFELSWGVADGVIQLLSQHWEASAQNHGATRASKL